MIFFLILVTSIQDISFFDAETVGDLTSRLGADCQQVSRVIGNDLNLIFRNVLQVPFPSKKTTVSGFLYKLRNDNTNYVSGHRCFNLLVGFVMASWFDYPGNMLCSVYHYALLWPVRFMIHILNRL